MGYAETIIFRPGFLAETSRGENRVTESIFGTVTGLLSYVSSSVQIPVGFLTISGLYYSVSLVWKVSKLGKAMCIAGNLGATGLPPAVHAIQKGSGDSSFTVIDNAGALKLSELNE